MQQLIDERSLAVVDVGNDGDVSNGTGHEGANSLKKGAILAWMPWKQD
jgi:hypothetical protein